MTTRRAILGSLALPPFAARLSRERLSRAAETLSADISEARFQAARKGHALHLRSQAGGDWFRPTTAAQSMRRLLVVEDSAFFRELVVPALAAEGYDVERETLETALVDALRQAFRHLCAPETYLDDYRQLCLNLGRQVHILQTDETVTALDIDADAVARLVVVGPGSGEQTVEPRVDGMAFYLGKAGFDPDVLVYGVVDGERSGVWAARLMAE